MLKIYGIPNCDTTKKTQNWFQKAGMAVPLHDYKKDGIDAGTLKQWIREAGLDIILNKRSTTWRELSAADQARANNPAQVIDLLQTHTSLIKRPIITQNGKIVAVGYHEPAFQQLLEKQ
ncbi:MAG: Spx/MgsR family RNA polymerase-binding regulatory protein [Chitinophagaceae bacterium]|nr:Spx/MgsR family RNA polymerase-binding regulatory protein [Chitinophagaceae bacterium]